MKTDLKLKTYEQLQFEITKLNTDIFLKNKEIERLNNIINELEKSIIFKLTEFKRNKDYFIDEKDIEQLYEELKELKESGNNE